MVVKKPLKSDVLKELNHFRDKIIQHGLSFEKLIIFGSQVKGWAKPWSDIDVCVVSKIFGKNRHTERVRLMKLTDDDSLRIEPHPYHPKDLADKWDPLAHEIRKYGIVWKETAP